VTDNNNITIKESDNETKTFSSFSQLLANSSCSYQMIIENEVVIRHIVVAANSKLLSIRKENPSAGGLIVASSIMHAKKILNILQNDVQIQAVLVTCREDEPSDIISHFKDSSIPWIVSVGMISEGTNIPRLQVCCHLTRIKTELHFRQILGRILRMTNSINKEACLFMPAEQKLVEYACRVAEDIPDEKSIVCFDKSKLSICIDKTDEQNIEITEDGVDQEIRLNVSDSLDDQKINNSSHLKPSSLLTKTYEANLNVFGQFQQEILAVNLSPFD
jgi:superfamily II DNA or RNA helicase